MVGNIKVTIWGKEVGRLTWDASRKRSVFEYAQEILEQREETVIAGKDITLESLYEVGTSAGGQHTKAVIARNNKTGEIKGISCYHGKWRY